MKLVYQNTGVEVLVGDEVFLDVDRRVVGGPKEMFIVQFFRKPHKPSSLGKVTITRPNDDIGMEYYVSTIGAQWIEREDRQDFLPPSA